MSRRPDKALTVRSLAPVSWLAIAVVLLAVSNGRWILPAAAWLGPVFMLHFVDSTRRWPGLLGVLVTSLILWPFSWQGMIPAPGWLYFMVTTIYAAVYFLPYFAHRLWATASTGFASTLVFPTTWVGVEVLFQRFGTPYGSWTSLAYSQLDFSALTQLASITGSGGITFLLTWFAATVAWLWRTGFTARRLRLAAVAYGIPWVAVMAFGIARLATGPPAEPPLQLAAITPPPELEDGFITAFRSAVAAGDFDEAALADLRAAATRLNADLLSRTRQAAEANADVIAWSETAARVMPADVAELQAEGQRLAETYGLVLVLAYAVWDPESTPPVSNQLTILRPDQSAPVHYRKAHPIYGAESAFMDPGNETVAVVDTQDLRLGAVICHDLDFPPLLREAGRSRVELLFAPSADWSEIESMHADMAKLRAIENGFTLFRPTAGGRTLAVDTRGREATWLERDGALTTSIAPTRVATIYSRIGDLFSWLCVPFCLLLLVASQRRASLPESATPAAPDAS